LGGKKIEKSRSPEESFQDALIKRAFAGPYGQRARKKPFRRTLITALTWAGPALGRIGPVRSALVNSREKQMRKSAKIEEKSGIRPPGVIRDRLAVGVAILRTLERALAENRLSRASMTRLLQILIGDALDNPYHGNASIKERFYAEHGTRPPGFLLVSPTKACNLHCVGCYADSGPSREKLRWNILTRIVAEARNLWGAPFIVISGGEPMAYKDDGKDILALAEKYQDSYFMMYTNGTLIDDAAARRMGELGNISPAISVEGFREKTERRRGKGVYDKILAAMERLRREKVFFGISITATRDNAEEALSEEVMDYYFLEQGALYAWVFHYMPIGRAFTLNLLPTPEQRLTMYRKAWQLVYERHYFLADFWNSGTASFGCISAGHGGGYLTIDWNGAIAPCVFVPYSPVNIHDIYAQGKTLTDAWAHPFFARLRSWQDEYSNEKKFCRDGHHGNWLMPCPNRDHHEEFCRILQDYDVKPVDENAAEALADSEYHRGLAEYDKEVARLLDPIWKTRYFK